MKNLKLTLLFLLTIPYAMIADANVQQNLERQRQQLQEMLIRCNDVYIHDSIPMYEQDLNTQWWLGYLTTFKVIQAHHCYNAEVLLRESKNLADVIGAIEIMQESESYDDLQAQQLKQMFINSNDAYIHSTPMYKQDLTQQWYLAFCSPPLRLFQQDHYYNAEILLRESKNLADLIVAMIYFKNKR